MDRDILVRGARSFYMLHVADLGTHWELEAELISKKTTLFPKASTTNVADIVRLWKDANATQEEPTFDQLAWICFMATPADDIDGNSRDLNLENYRDRIEQYHAHRLTTKAK